MANLEMYRGNFDVVHSMHITSSSKKWALFSTTTATSLFVLFPWNFLHFEHRKRKFCRDTAFHRSLLVHRFVLVQWSTRYLQFAAHYKDSHHCHILTTAIQFPTFH